MQKILLLSLLFITNQLYSQFLINDTTKGVIIKEYDFFSAEVFKLDGKTIDVSLETSIIFRSYGDMSEVISTNIIEQIDKVYIKSSPDVYNFLLGWERFNSNEQSPLEKLPMLSLLGTRFFLSNNQKSELFKGTQQIFTVNINDKPVYLIVHFQRTNNTGLEITIIKENGTFITFYNLP